MNLSNISKIFSAVSPVSKEKSDAIFENLFYEIFCTPSTDNDKVDISLEIGIGEDEERPVLFPLRPKSPLPHFSYVITKQNQREGIVGEGLRKAELLKIKSKQLTPVPLPETSTKKIYQASIPASDFELGDNIISVIFEDPKKDNGKGTYYPTHAKNAYTLGEIGVAVGDVAVTGPVTSVKLTRADTGDTIDLELWRAIKRHSLNFDTYSDFMDDIICNPKDGYRRERDAIRRRSPFIKSDEYNLIKFGTEFFMLFNFGISAYEMKNYVGTSHKLPYYDFVIKRIKDQLLLDDPDNLQQFFINHPRFRLHEFFDDCAEREFERLYTPFMVELIWNYWMEQGMLVQTLNVINLRFQNLQGNKYRDPLMRFNTDPLRPLSHILWGYIQDEQHRLSIPRRVTEYRHEYGLKLTGTAVPPSIGEVDIRVKFLETFHTLLTMCTIYFKESDDTTRIADAFPILNALKEVHLLLAEGNHNAYGNLTWTARQEMMMQQYILARPEMREFLGGRVMVPYQEPWMDRVDTMRALEGWGSTSIVYFYELAVHGEQILLSIRYGNWSDVNLDRQNAANWAQEFRNGIQRYIHAYRTVTGVDLAVEQVIQLPNTFAIQPSFLIQQRLLIEDRARKRA